MNRSGNLTVLHAFTGGNDGANPFSGPTLDSAGNLYGTTNEGGSSGAGVVYKLGTAGNLTPLYSFTDGADGGYPWGGVVLDSNGNLYGTTNTGGAGRQGVVFKVSSDGQETVLCSFKSGKDGAYPQSPVTLDSAGNIYGTTYNGGAQDVGTVYEVTAAGRETVLWIFTDDPDGGYPVAGLILDAAGNLYGTTSFGGAWAVGSVFKIVP